MVFEKLITLLPLDRINPDLAEVTDSIAHATLGSYQALWHPAFLSRSSTLPVFLFASDPPLAAPGQFIIVPELSAARLPSGWLEQAEAGGSVVVSGGASRDEFLKLALDRLPGESARVHEQEGFYALGLARLYLDMLRAYMHHESTLDEEHLQKEVLAAAAAAVVADTDTQTDHLRAAFQIVAEARERLYGADIYLLDFCLVDPNAGLDRLGKQLAEQLPINVFASGKAIERLSERDASATGQLRELLEQGRCELIGGEYEEVASVLLPLESHLKQFDRGAEAYRGVLGRVPVIFGRRRFGLARYLLQLLNRLEFLHLTHFCFDGGLFPIKTDPKVRWEAPDSSTVEALTRVPFAAGEAAEFMRFPARLARTIAADFVATLTMAHWPMPDLPWYRELLLMSRYANVFGKFSTLSNYFQNADSPALSSAVSSDEYLSPFLEFEHQRSSPGPISDYARQHRARARLDQVRSIQTICRLLGGQMNGGAERWKNLEQEIDLGRTAADALVAIENDSVRQLADVICPASRGVTSGTLVFNPLNWERRVAIPVGGGSGSAEGGSGEGLEWVSLAVPSMGYAWAAAGPPAPANDRTRALAEGHTIRNEFLEVEIDPASGGIKFLKDHTVRFAQLAQQLVLVGIDERGGGATDRGEEPIRSVMKLQSAAVQSPGPEYACLVVEGELIATRRPAWSSGSTMGRFRQIYRLARGDAILRITIEVLDLVSGLFHASDNPWQSYLASRIAWPDSRSVVLRGIGTVADPTRSQRLESPHFIEIHGKKNRVAMLAGGLPFHRRFGTRMLDTLLVTATERCRMLEIALGIDLPNPFQAALDLVTAPVMIARSGPPPAGPGGWFLHLDSRNVVITSMSELGDSGRGLRLRLFESAGRYTRGRLRCPYNVAEARLTDFRGQRLATLDSQGDTVMLDLAPREVTQLEIEFSFA